MLATTPPLLYLPHRLLLHLGAPLWTQHASAWDHIFSHGMMVHSGANPPVSVTLPRSCPPRLIAEERIQRGYQRLSASQSQGHEGGGRYTGVLGQLMEKGQLSLELIKANITELMAGGVDTVCVCVCDCLSPL